MSNIKISQMTAAGALTGTETVAGLQSGSNVQINVQDIADLAGSSGFQLTNVKITYNSATILQMGTTPQNLVAAQGANTIIVPVNCFFVYRYGTVDYATNTNILFSTNNTLWQVTFNSVLAGSADRITSRAITPTTSLSGSIPTNLPLQISVAGGNPTAGDGELDVYLTYYVQTL